MSETGDRPRYVIAGLGSIGRRHLGNLRRLRPSGVIGALRRPGSLSALPDGCDVQFTALGDALAFKPDAAILAGPATTHIEMAQVFVESGIPVLIEKPLSIDLAGLASLARAAQLRDAPVMIGYNMRFSQTLAALRAEVKAGVIGDVVSVRAEVGQYLPDWRPGSDYRASVSARRDLGGGALLELSHEIDYIYWLFGMPDRVGCRAGRLSRLDMDVEDCVELCLDYSEPQRMVAIHLDFLRRPAARSCTLIGLQGTIHWDALADRYTVEIAEPYPQKREVERLAPDRNQMYLDELAAFLAAAERSAPVLIPLTEGIDVMRIIDAARRSIAEDRVERIAPLEPVA